MSISAFDPQRTLGFGPLPLCRFEPLRCLPFLGATGLAEDRVERRLAAILAADVAGYSRLMGADEKGTHTRLKELRAARSPDYGQRHGREMRKRSRICNNRLPRTRSLRHRPRCSGIVTLGGLPTDGGIYRNWHQKLIGTARWPSRSTKIIQMLSPSLRA
jgi:hypothetical protein